MRIEWHNQGFYDLRRAPGVVEDLERRGRAVAAAAGDGFELGSQQGAKRPQGRWRVGVVTATPEAMRKSAKHDALLKALDAGR